MAQSGSLGWNRVQAHRGWSPTRWPTHPSHNVANKPWQFEVSIPRKQLQPAYGEGFQGAPLDCSTHAEGGGGADD